MSASKSPCRSTSVLGLASLALACMGMCSLSFVFSSTPGKNAESNPPALRSAEAADFLRKSSPLQDPSSSTAQGPSVAVLVSMAVSLGLVMGLASAPARAEEKSQEFYRLLRPPTQVEIPYFDNPIEAEEQAKNMIRAAGEAKAAAEASATQTEQDGIKRVIDNKKAREVEINNMPPTKERSIAADELAETSREELTRLTNERIATVEAAAETWRVDRAAATQMASAAKATSEVQRKGKIAWKDEVEKQAGEERTAAELQARIKEQDTINQVAQMKRDEGVAIQRLPQQTERNAAEQELNERTRVMLEDARNERAATELAAKTANAEARNRAATLVDKGPPLPNPFGGQQ